MQDYGGYPLKMCFVFFSGEWESLWFREAERDADQGQHGGPAWADPHSPLWALPPLQTRRDGIQRHRPRQQTFQVRIKSRSHWLSWKNSLPHHTLSHEDVWSGFTGINEICGVLCLAFRKHMRPRGMSSWVSFRRKRRRWGRCLSRESKRRRQSWKRQKRR